MTKIIASLLGLGVMLSAPCSADEYRIGRATTDITLPAWGIQMLGYVHPQQIGQGLRQRQFARAFVIADSADRTRLAYVTCEVAFLTHTVKLAVVERVHEKLGDRYTDANLVLAGTHTHGVPGGYHHHVSTSVLKSDFFPQAFDALVDGIVESVVSADADLKPGRIFLAQGELKNASANRSAIAYRNNPAEERARYAGEVDTTMTLLKFVRDDGEIGLLNWFAVHPTSVNFHYKLTTSDNKGYAAYLVEKAHGVRYSGKGEFVAAFANTNCGDATPNLNLDATGPGRTDLDGCEMIGKRQADTAARLFASASEPLAGPIDVRHTFVDFSHVVVSDEFTGAGQQHTCSSAWGYSFAAGSDAEGGGHPLFHEGMTKSDPGIDSLIRLTVGAPKPSAEFIACHKPKAILLASSLTRPPVHEQVLPLAVAKIGQLVLVIGPAEYTTMSGRRFRAAVGRELGVDPRYVVVAGYANDFAGYVTTWHEYQLQQYEGGHTLYGPWTEAAYRQEFTRLAHSLKTGESLTPAAKPTDMRAVPHREVSLDGPDERDPVNAHFGDIVATPRDKYTAGDVVKVSFWTGSPVNDYGRCDKFLAVERQVQAPDKWEVVREDSDWDTTAEWARITSASGRPEPSKPPQNAAGVSSPPRYVPKPDPFQVTIVWESSSQTPPGTYRIVHFGRYKQGGKVQRFTARSANFQIGP